jgi:hypothetical protein
MWPQFRSPLMWDVFAVNTYLTVSLLFWYIGWSPTWPRSATARRTDPQLAYGLLALGWRGSATATGTATSGPT